MLGGRARSIAAWGYNIERSGIHTPHPTHPHTPYRSIQRSLSAVQALRGDSSGSLVAPPPGIPRADSSLPPLTELSPSGKWVGYGVGLYKYMDGAVGGMGMHVRHHGKGRCWYVDVDHRSPQIPHNTTTNTAQAARGAWAVVKAGDSSLKDRLEAAKVLLFLTFEDPTSRFVFKLVGWVGGWVGGRRVGVVYK